MGRRIVPRGTEVVDGRKVRSITPTPGETSYTDRLKNLIPAETAALYISGVAIIPTGQKVGLIVWASFCLILTVIYMAWQSKKVEDQLNSHGIDWVHVTIASISFVLWVYTLGGPFTAYGVYISWIGTLLILAWTFIVPNFYKGQPAA
jgi:hypothetical protein